jgi:hypothetical protein
MPYKSKAQQAYFNVNRKELEAEGVNVDEWNAASRGKKLPKKAKKHAFMIGYRGVLKQAGLAEPSDQDRLIAILAQLQHHLDDAESYGGQGLQLPAHLSLDDAEEGVEDLSETLLPPGKAKVIEEVAEKGDEEEEEKGVEEPGHEQEKEGSALPDDVSPEAAFELGLRRGLQKLGFASMQLEAMVEVGIQHGLGNIKTAGDVVEALTPYAIADTHEKLAAEESHPLNRALREALAKTAVPQK